MNELINKSIDQLIIQSMTTHWIIQSNNQSVNQPNNSPFRLLYNAPVKQPRKTGENLELTEEQKKFLAAYKLKQEEEAEKRVIFD